MGSRLSKVGLLNGHFTRLTGDASIFGLTTSAWTRASKPVAVKLPETLEALLRGTDPHNPWTAFPLGAPPAESSR
jgi:hypothetical protein